MLPTSDTSAGRLAEVLTSCLAALNSEPNPLNLGAVRSAIVVLVDGLGAKNLSERRGHARALTAGWSTRDVVETVFPSTTAAALASLATGLTPQEHGVMGYTVRDLGAGGVVNMLTGWDAQLDPDADQPAETVFEQAVRLGLSATVIGSARYRASGFTRAILRGADYQVADSFDDRVDAALAAAQKPGLVYLYISELDTIAHSSGWQSTRWIAELERLDAAWTRLGGKLGRQTGALLTADHGVLDVPADRQIDLVQLGLAELDRVTDVAGDPRSLYLWLSGGADSVRAAKLALELSLRQRATVLTRDEAFDAGLFGMPGLDQNPCHPRAAERVGDLLVVAHGEVAFYFGRHSTMTSRRMVGQHGAWSDDERQVPLIRSGAFG